MPIFELPPQTHIRICVLVGQGGSGIREVGSERLEACGVGVVPMQSGETHHRLFVNKAVGYASLHPPYKLGGNNLDNYLNNYCFYSILAYPGAGGGKANSYTYNYQAGDHNFRQVGMPPEGYSFH